MVRVGYTLCMFSIDPSTLCSAYIVYVKYVRSVYCVYMIFVGNIMVYAENTWTLLGI